MRHAAAAAWRILFTELFSRLPAAGNRPYNGDENRRVKPLKDSGRNQTLKKKQTTIQPIEAVAAAIQHKQAQILLDGRQVSCQLPGILAADRNALAVGDRIAMMENAVFSILTPEGFASILWKDASRAAEAAVAMKPTAWQAKAMGIVDEVIREEGAGAHEHPEQAARSVKEYVISSLRELEGIPVSELIRMRQERFSRIGVE